MEPITHEVYYRLGRERVASVNAKGEEKLEKPVNRVVLVKGAQTYVQQETEEAPNVAAFKKMYPDVHISGIPGEDDMADFLAGVSAERLAAMGYTRVDDVPPS